MRVNPRLINVLVLIIFVLSLLSVLGCGNSENETKVNDLKNRVNALKSQQAQLNQEFKTAKEKQGWFRNNILPDTMEVKALSKKIKEVESEIAATEKELAALTGSSDYSSINDMVDNVASTLVERIAR